jgi:hypothetical protein
MEKNELVKDLIAAGYFISPNNIHSLPGVLMYAGGPDRPCFPIGTEVQVLNDRIRVFSVKFFGKEYTRESFHDTVTVAVFDSAEKYLVACPDKSLGGASYSNSWD